MIDDRKCENLASALGISEEELELLEELGMEFNQHTSNDGHDYYGWVIIPEGTPKEILKKNGWRVGQLINDLQPNFPNGDEDYFD